MSKSLVEKAVAVSRLMELSSAIGAAAEVKDNGDVFLTTSPDGQPSRIGGSVNEAVLHLEKIHDSTAQGTVDAASA